MGLNYNNNLCNQNKNVIFVKKFNIIDKKRCNAKSINQGINLNYKQLLLPHDFTEICK